MPSGDIGLNERPFSLDGQAVFVGADEHRLSVEGEGTLVQADVP